MNNPDNGPADDDPVGKHIDGVENIEELKIGDWERILHAVRMFSMNTEFAQTIGKVEKIYARAKLDGE